jgi:hypothetical protein
MLYGRPYNFFASHHPVLNIIDQQGRCQMDLNKAVNCFWNNDLVTLHGHHIKPNFHVGYRPKCEFFIPANYGTRLRQHSLTLLTYHFSRCQRLVKARIKLIQNRKMMRFRDNYILHPKLASPCLNQLRGLLFIFITLMIANQKI